MDELAKHVDTFRTMYLTRLHRGAHEDVVVVRRVLVQMGFEGTAAEIGYMLDATGFAATGWPLEAPKAKTPAPVEEEVPAATKPAKKGGKEGK